MPRTGTGRVYQRGNVWWLQYGHRGKTYRESSESTRKGDATALLKRRLSEMGSGTFVGPQAERVTVKDLADGLLADYRVNGRKSLDRAEGCLARVQEYFGADGLALDISLDRLNLYVLHRREDGVALATVQRELAVLRRAFNLAVRAGRLSVVPPFPELTIDNARQGFLDGADLERVIGELPDYLRPVVRFAALTGWRKGEIRALTWAQVDFDAGTIRLEPGTTKNKDGRTFPFAVLPPLVALMEAQRERTRALERQTATIVPRVFHRDGSPIRSMRTAWDAACRRAGVPDAIFHDLRRTAVRNLERAGVARSVAMRLTGHRTEEIYRRYAIADAASLEEGVEKLAKLHAEPSKGRKVIPMEVANG